MGNTHSNKHIVDSYIPHIEEFNITLVGQTNSGKSSLLDALIGIDLLPIKHVRETSKYVCIKYRNFDVPRLVVSDLSRGSRYEIHGVAEIVSELKNINKEMRDKKLNSDNIYLTLYTKMKYFDNIGTELDFINFYDTPGLMENPINDEQTFDLIEKSDVVLFLVSITSLSDMNVFNNYKKISEYVSIGKTKDLYVIITNIDIDDDDNNVNSLKNIFIEDFKKNDISLDIDHVIPISSRIYREKSDVITSNFIELLSRLNQIISCSAYNTIKKSMIQFIETLDYDRELADNLVNDKDAHNKKIILPYSFEQKLIKHKKHKKLFGIATVACGLATMASIIPIMQSFTNNAGAECISGLVSSITGVVATYVSISSYKSYEISKIRNMLISNKIFDFDEYIHRDVMKGFIKDTDEQVIIYDGGFKGARYHGHGIMYHPNGKKFIIGQFVDGRINGDTYIYDESEVLVFSGNITREYYGHTKKININGMIHNKNIVINDIIDIKHQHTEIVYRNPTREINLRKYPTMNSDSIFKIKRDNKIFVKKHRCDNWYQVMVNGKEGFIKIVDDYPPSNPDTSTAYYIVKSSFLFDIDLQ
jgi:hypothetical protein